MALETISKRSYNDEEMHHINHSFVRELNIYNQALLTRESALKKAYVIEKGGHELGAIFDLQGELKGSVVCLIDLYGKTLSPSEVPFFQSLFKESMNILLGSVLTNLEEVSHIMSVISFPRLIGCNDMVPGAIADNLGVMKVWAIDYKLHLPQDSFNCKIYIVCNRKNTIEV